ncbi:MAG TPA: hypothetical protein VJC03_00125, partial [bacterium]|nr:hypothetical protein [bacterium]
MISIQKKIIRFRELALLNEVFSVIFFSLVMGLFSGVRIYLPWTEVPVTLQTLGIFLAPLFIAEYAFF